MRGFVLLRTRRRRGWFGARCATISSACIRSRRCPRMRAPGSAVSSTSRTTEQLRVLAAVESAEPESLEIAGSAGPAVRFMRFGRAGFELAGERHRLELYWLEGYGGGIFVPFGDATNGGESYGPGRYVLDSVKGADLGVGGGRLVRDV